MTPRLCIYTGRAVNPLALQEQDVCVRSMAHSLALTNRFCGHTVEPISVAQHLVYASWLVLGAGVVTARQALFHDGAEAYLGDMTKWVKHSPACEGFRLAEEAAQRVVYSAVGCPTETLHEVEAADRLLVRFEGLMGLGDDWIVGHPAYPRLTDAEVERVHLANPNGEPWTFWDWRRAEREFMARYELVR